MTTPPLPPGAGPSSSTPAPAEGWIGGEARAAAGRPGHRDPGGRVGAILGWLAVIGLSLLVFLSANVPGLRAAREAGRTPAATASEPEPPGGMLELQGRYALGAERMSPGTGRAVIGQVDQLAATPADQLRVAMVAGEAVGPEAALERIEALELEVATAGGEPDAEDAEAAAPAPWLVEDLGALRAIYREGAPAAAALPASVREGLVARHGWFGRLALVYGAEDASPDRAAILASADRFMRVVLAGVALGGIAFIVGCALAIAGFVMALTGGLRARYAPPAPGGSVYIETFGLFLVGFVVLQFAAMGIRAATGADLSRGLVWLLPLVALWPRVRGATWAELKYALGWHRGRGFLREIGAGVVGYLAGLPIFALGVAMMLALLLLFGGKGPAPSHPIIDEVKQGGVWAVVGLYLLASVWAPLTEETMFRGAFYHHLRGRVGPVLAGLVVAFVFAAIHPQGWMAIPALMGLAVVFAMLREWRGSLIGPIVAHALHNGMLVTVLTLAMRSGG